MIGFGNSDWSYDPFEKMVIFPPDPLLIAVELLTRRDNEASMGGANKEVSTLRNCKISADPKGRLNWYYQLRL